MAGKQYEQGNAQEPTRLVHYAARRRRGEPISTRHRHEERHFEVIAGVPLMRPSDLRHRCGDFSIFDGAHISNRGLGIPGGE